MPSGPARAFFMRLHELLAVDASVLLVVFSAENLDYRVGKGGHRPWQETVVVQDLVATRMGDQIGQLQPGYVVRLGFHLELSAGQSGLECGGAHVIRALLPKAVERSRETLILAPAARFGHRVTMGIYPRKEERVAFQQNSKAVMVRVIAPCCVRLMVLLLVKTDRDDDVLPGREQSEQFVVEAGSQERIAEMKMETWR